jgi:hypothetical protein
MLQQCYLPVPPNSHPIGNLPLFVRTLLLPIIATPMTAAMKTTILEQCSMTFLELDRDVTHHGNGNNNASCCPTMNNSPALALALE